MAKAAQPTTGTATADASCGDGTASPEAIALATLESRTTERFQATVHVAPADVQGAPLRTAGGDPFGSSTVLELSAAPPPPQHNGRSSANPQVSAAFAEESAMARATGEPFDARAREGDERVLRARGRSATDDSKDVVQLVRVRTSPPLIHFDASSASERARPPTIAKVAITQRLRTVHGFPKVSLLASTSRTVSMFRDPIMQRLLPAILFSGIT